MMPVFKRAYFYALPQQRLHVCLRCALAVLLALSLMVCQALQAQIELPDFGDPAEADFSPAEEKEAGKIFMQYIRQNLNLIADAEVSRYMQRLGDRLLNSSKQVHQPIHVFLIHDRDINAFAGPGGNIGLNSGMILIADSESELAAVIAHELAHVTQRHIARLIQRSKETSLSTWAGVATALIIGMYNPQVGGAALATLIGGNIQASLDHSREHEKEADRVGAQYLTGAGFNTNGMYRFFEKLYRDTQFSESPPEFLSTHPLSINRMADMRDRIPSSSVAQHRSSLDFYLVKAKLRVLTSTRLLETLEWFTQRSKDVVPTERLSDEAATATIYGRALVLNRLGRFADATVVLQQLIQAYPEKLSFWIALSEAKTRSGDAAAALAIYEDNIDLYFDHKELVQSYAAGLLQQRAAAKALQLLYRHGRSYGFNAPLYRLLAEAYDQQGKAVESHLAIAEYHYANGHLGSAIAQVEYAQTITPDSDYLDLRLAARLEELKAERKGLPFGIQKPAKIKPTHLSHSDITSRR